MSSFLVVKMFSFGLKIFLLEDEGGSSGSQNTQETHKSFLWGCVSNHQSTTRERRLLSGPAAPQLYRHLQWHSPHPSPARKPSWVIPQARGGWNCLFSLPMFSLELVSPGEVTAYLFILSDAYFWIWGFLFLEPDRSLFFTLLSLLNTFAFLPPS